MTDAAPPQPRRVIRRALARVAYRDDRVRLCDGDLRGQHCLIASRQGLFAATPHAAKRIAYGFFFGLCRYGDAIFAFEACDATNGTSHRGRIVRLSLADGYIVDTTVIAHGLDNQCHQIAIIDASIHVVDTAHQLIARFTLAGTPCAPLTPFRIVPRDDVGTDYLHINAIRQVGEEIVVMLHNGAGGPVRPSELAWIDRDGRLVRRLSIAGHGCHDIEQDEKGGLWHCGSMAGELLGPDGARIKVTDRMTRGLAIMRDAIVVGTSMFGPRQARGDLGGSVLFLDRDFATIAEIALTAGPTDLIAL